MFHKTTTKLTVVYLAVLMAISLFFTANIYQLSVGELDRGLRGPNRGGMGIEEDYLSPLIQRQLRSQRERVYDEARQHIINRLAFVNLIILVGGGFLCYYLALRTLKPIEESHAALERFTADASHELRTPLSVMKSENEIALMDTKLTTAEAKEILSSNIEEVDKMTGLVQGLLQLARMDDELQKEPTSSKSMVEEVLKSLSTVAEQKKIKLDITGVKDSEINCDKMLVTQVLSIITKNAINYSTAESTVKIKGSSDGRNYQFQIIDEGIGISEADQLHIFDRFYRGDSSRNKEENDGYGLGLAIAKNIVDLHGGKIELKSKPGKGSVFTVSVPT